MKKTTKKQQKNKNNTHHNKNNNNHVFDVILTSNALKSMLMMLMQWTHYSGYTHNMCVRSFSTMRTIVIDMISNWDFMDYFAACSKFMRKIFYIAYPISLRHRNSWAIRLGWLVGIKYFSANRRFFGRCSCPFNEVRKTVLKVPSPMRRWILKMLSTSGIWVLNSAISSMIAWLKQNIALDKWNEILHSHVHSTCLHRPHASHHSLLDCKTWSINSNCLHCVCLGI